MNTRGSPKPHSGHVSSQRARFALSNLPIRHRLPLLIGTLLFGIISLSIWASYRGVRESALEVGGERLRSLTQQLANQSQQSLPGVLARTFTAANEPAVRAFLQSPSPATRSGALVSQQRFNDTNDSNSLQVELWNSNPAPVLTVLEGLSPEPAGLELEHG